MSSVAVLLSGGIDSTALAYWKRPDYAITIDYGQASALAEIRAARHISKELGITQDTISVDCRSLGSGDLAGKESLPGSPAPEWWPFRNQLLITIGAMHAITRGIEILLIGSVRSDSFHMDGTKEFYQKVDDLVHLQEGGIRIMAPAISFNAIDLVKKSSIPTPLLGWTHSCHKAEFACGNCRGCNKHEEIMAELLSNP